MMAQLGKKVGAAIFVIVASTSFSHALSIEKCSEAEEVVFMIPHGFEGDYENLGHSLALYRTEFSYEDKGSQSVILTQCRSGETLTIWGDRNGRFSHDYVSSKAVTTLVKQYVSSSQSYSFPSLNAELKTNGLEVELTTAGEEICPCKAFYPQDRLKKTPYVFKPGYSE